MNRFIGNSLVGNSFVDLSDLSDVSSPFRSLGTIGDRFMGNNFVGNTV